MSRVDFQDSQKLNGFLNSSGATSIKQAIETDKTLSGSAQTVRVSEAREYGVYNANNIDYLGVEFTVEVIA